MGDGRGKMRLCLQRREFIAALGGLTAWPVAARGQQREKLPIIGILGSATAAAQGQLVAGLIERLRRLGWIDGRTVAIESRWAEGRAERFAEIADEFVRLNVNLIVTGGTASVEAIKRATSVIPIVFWSAGDPVGNGLVASLARPGGNVTGLANQQTDTAAKRLGLLRELVPGLRRLAILANVGNAAAVIDMQEVETTARNLGLDPIILQIRRAEDIADR
jgi:putative ABC transport system substrate-binding protein